MEAGQFQQLLSAIINQSSSNKVAASGGSKYFNGAIASENLTSFYVREDTSITALSGTDGAGTTVNWLTQLNISGVTLKAGDLYSVPNGCKIVSGTVSSGSIIGYR